MAVVTLAFSASSFGKPFTGSGFLVPSVDGRLIKAATFSTVKWGWYDDSDGVLEEMSRWIVEAAAKPDEVVGLFIDGEVVGGSGLHPRIGSGGLEIGYWVHRRFTRRGIATTTSRLLTNHAFGRSGIDRVEIHHDKANTASEGVPRALGFSLVGEVAVTPETPEQSGVHLIWRFTRDEWVLRGP